MTVWENAGGIVPWDPDTVGHCDLEEVYSRMKDGTFDTLKVPKLRNLTSDELEMLYGDNDGCSRTFASTLNTAFSEEQGRSTCVPSFEGDYDVTLACTMPAVCFCASKKTAQACCILLQKVATLYGADPTRIKVLDADTKNCKGWHSRFSYDPNKYAHHCDILFATSVIGAGFSIDTHFVHFYAILFNNILTHIEEQQLIGRLRYILQDFSDASIKRNIPEKDRVSLMYISPGHGSMLSLQWFEKDIEKIKRTTMAMRGASQIK